ncbi:MAG TPA: hypothetical protein VLP43_09700, partial [Solirubrobacteraceae bacterium]|nr:hypothetical protein [Solirubrobacteraceae bacterium]
TVLVLFAVSQASAAARRPGCQAGKVPVASGCVSRREAANHIVAITRATMRALRVMVAIVRVDTGSRPLLSRAFGNSMAGVPARRHMRFRIGSMAGQPSSWGRDLMQSTPLVDIAGCRRSPATMSGPAPDS